MSSERVTRSRALSQPDLLLPFCDSSTHRKKRVSAKKISQDMMAGGQGREEGKEVFEIPENIEAITPERWFAMFNALNSTLTSLRSEIGDLKSLKGKVESFSTEWKEGVDNTLGMHDDINDKMDFKNKLLVNMIINQEERIQQLESRATMAYQREIKPNMIIHGIIEPKEEKREELMKAIASFFKDVMLIEGEIELSDVFRMGQGNARPVLIKLAHPSDKATIFTNAPNLQEKLNAKKKMYFIHDDMSDEQAETRRFYRELQKENKENKDQDGKLSLKIKMQRGQIMVNNETVKAKVFTPSKADILRLNEQELEVIRATKLVTGPEHIEQGSEYFSYAVKAKNITEIKKAYTKLRIKHADATHISCSYRLENPIGPFRQQAIDDKDFGIGRTILKVLKGKEAENTAVFIVRYYGNVHLGKRRFEIAEQLSDRVLQDLTKKLVKKQLCTQRQNSQASIMSVASTLDSQDELSDENEQVKKPAVDEQEERTVT